MRLEIEHGTKCWLLGRGLITAGEGILSITRAIIRFSAPWNDDDGLTIQEDNMGNKNYRNLCAQLAISLGAWRAIALGI
jgi:hypothetical protein